jgi:peptidyl-prolyl cis-trans isomerase SurA
MLRVLCAGAALLVATAGRAEVVNRIIATVDGDPITAHELERYAAERGADGDVPRDELLQALVTDRLLEKEATAQGIAASPEEIDAYVAQVKQRNRIDDAQFADALRAQGLTLEQYRARVKAEIEKTALVTREIRQRVNVSPEEVERHYREHLDDYAVSEQVTVRVIFFALDGPPGRETEYTRAKAEEVRDLARDGRRFAALAEQFSEGPGADKGGLLGTFGRGEMDAALDDVAFDLAPGKVSDPIATSRGFHLLYVEEKVASGHKPLEDVQEEIKDALYGEAVQSRYEDFLVRSLRERHHVEVLN